MKVDRDHNYWNEMHGAESIVKDRKEKHIDLEKRKDSIKSE